MRNRAEIKVMPEFIENIKLNDEYFFRELARKIVSEMPLAELHKLIRLNKINPNSNESKKTLIKDRCTLKANLIRQLRDEGVILYSAEVNLP